MSKDFEIEKTRGSRMRASDIEHVEGEVVDAGKYLPVQSGKDRLLGAVADNFDRILDIATSIVEIEKTNAEADAHIRELEEKRKMLAAEADAYVAVLNAETNSVISKAEIIRKMMQDYYVHGSDKLTGEEFSAILQEVINSMGDNNG